MLAREAVLRPVSTMRRIARWRVLKGGLPSSTRVKIGTTDGTKTEVVEGPLVEGDQVITDATLTDAAKASSPALPGAPPGGPGRRPF